MTTEKTLPANGDHTTDGTPHGYSTITPFVAVQDPDGALDFYTSVFGARVVNCSRMGGRVVHAELAFAQGRLQLGAAQEAYHLQAVDPASEDVQFSLALYVPDVDAAVERAVAAGAVLREPAMTFVSGDRFASVRDPFGIRWSVMTRVEDLSDEESAARIEEWVAAQ